MGNVLNNKKYTHNLYVVENMTCKEISQKLDISITTVAKYIKKHGLTKSQADRKIDKDSLFLLSNYHFLYHFYMVLQYTTRDIAKLLGVGKRTVVKAIYEYDISMRHSYKYQLNNKNLNKENLENLYVHEELSMEIISQRYGVSRMTIQRRLKKHNIPLRKPTDMLKISGIHKENLIPLLEKFDISHITSYIIEVITPTRTFCYEIDEYLPELKVFVELQGEYWHGYLQRNESEKNKSICKNITRDKHKRSFLNKNFPDHKLVYILDSDFKNGIADDIVLRIMNNETVPLRLP